MTGEVTLTVAGWTPSESGAFLAPSDRRSLVGQSSSVADKRPETVRNQTNGQHAGEFGDDCKAYRRTGFDIDGLTVTKNGDKK